jgi:hypothetical protein
MEMSKFKDGEYSGARYKSEGRALYTASEDELLKGGSQNTVEIQLLPSLFRNKNNHILKGHQVTAASIAPGSTANNLTYDTMSGFGLRINITQNPLFLLTAHTNKVPLSQILTDLAGTVAYLGMFGMGVIVIETILTGTWPCAKKVKLRLNAVLLGEDMDSKLSGHPSHFEASLRLSSAAHPPSVEARHARPDDKYTAPSFE